MIRIKIILNVSNLALILNYNIYENVILFVIIEKMYTYLYVVTKIPVQCWFINMKRD